MQAQANTVKTVSKSNVDFDRYIEQLASSEKKPVAQNDEIDLIDLVKVLWAQKNIIVAVALLTTAAAGLYAVAATAVYEARVSVFPPVLNQFAALNDERGQTIDLPPLKASDIYTVFTRALESDEVKQKFLNEVYLPERGNADTSQSQKESLYNRLQKNLTVKSDKLNGDRYAVSFQDTDSAQSARYLRLYVELADRYARDEIMSSTQREAETKGENIQRTMQSLRQKANALRSDRIIQLKEALVVADAVGIVEPSSLTGQQSQQQGQGTGSMYLRGSKALQAEINTLQSRASDEPFIEDFREIEEKYNAFKLFKLNGEKLSTFRFDGVVEAPVSPIKPQRFLIVALGLIAGGMLGILAAFIRHQVHIAKSRFDKKDPL